ncbi:DUF4333 domain-containing protein [Nocardia sp. NPDC004722]
MITLVICAIIIVGLLVVIAIILAVGQNDTSGPRPAPALTPGAVETSTDTARLDQAAVEAGVVRVLNDSYGVSDITDVRCPSSMLAQVNTVYVCTLRIGGENKKVSVKVTSADGTYEVGRPS